MLLVPEPAFLWWPACELRAAEDTRVHPGDVGRLGFGKMSISLACDHILEVIFSYLELSELRNCALVCHRWYHLLCDENNDVWRLHCVRRLAEEALKSDLLSSLPTYKSKLRAFHHAWNPDDTSRNIYVKPNGFTIHRNPVAQV